MSRQDAPRFAGLLTDALYQIKKREGKAIAVIQDEIGYAMGRRGGSVVESWRKGGHMPQRKADIERLAGLLVERGGLPRPWLEEYLEASGYGPERAALCEQLFPGTGVGPGAGPRAAPFQAPAAITHFVGRRQELDAVCARLRQDPGPRLVALTGMGGVGKTTLATQVAHSLAAHFPGGVLWGHAAGDEPLDIAEQWAKTLGYDLGGLQDRRNRAAALRGLLVERETLLVIDDAQSAEDVRPLLPGGERCAVLLTTRNEDVAGALGAAIFRLDELPPAHSLELLAAILGPERLFAEQNAAQHICRQLQHLPLAIEIAGQLLKTRPNRFLGDMANHLEALDHRLNLRISDRAVRTSFSASWTALDAPQRAAFACLGVFGGRAFGAEAMAAVAGLDLYTAQDHLYTLKALSLLGEAAPDSFQQHPLLAGFAGEQLGEAPQQHCRMAAYYAEYAARHKEDDEALDAAWENIAAAMQTARRLQQWPLLLTFGRALAAFWGRRARFSQARQGYELMHAAAAALDDRPGQAFALHKWGWACLEQDSYAEAALHLEAALDLFVSLGDRAGEAEAHHGLARLALERAEYAAAEQQIAAYRRLCEEMGDRAGLARADYQAAYHAYHSGDMARTQRLCERALAIQAEQEDDPDILATIRLLADVAIEGGEYAAAAGRCREALAIAERLHNQGEIAAVYYSMTVVARRQNRLTLARNYSNTALALFEKMGDQDFLALVLYEQSRLHSLLGEPHAAHAAAERSAAHFTAQENSFSLVYVLDHLGAVALELGRTSAAQEYWLRALALAEPMRHPLLENLRRHLASIQLHPPQP